MRIEPSGEILGATIADVDLSRPVADADFKRILRALGEFGVLCLEPSAHVGQQRHRAQCDP
jgi:taurine dioxygenase